MQVEDDELAVPCCGVRVGALADADAGCLCVGPVFFRAPQGIFGYAEWQRSTTARVATGAWVSDVVDHDGGKGRRGHQIGHARKAGYGDQAEGRD